MAGLLARLLAVHTVQVETYESTNGKGQDVFLTPIAVTGFLDGRRQMIRDKDGEETVSESTFYCSLADASRFTLESRVTASDGTVSRVLKVNPLDTGGLAGRVEHVEVSLT